MEGFFVQLVLILLFARFFGELFARFKTPAVLGELFAGILLGPSLFNWIEPSVTIQMLAEIGVVLLLFEVGIESDISRLLRAGKSSLLAAIVGVAAPFALGFGLSYYFFSFNLLVSLFIGGTLTATSIGITMRVLSNLKRQDKHDSQIVLGAAILDDVLGIVFLALLYEFSVGQQVDLFAAQRILLFIIVFMLIAPIVAKLVSAVIREYDEKSTIPGLIPSTIVSLILFFAWLSHKMGAPELLGGFAAGLALSQRFSIPLPDYFKTPSHFAESVENKMKPIIHLFTPIFFVNIGLMLNLRGIDWNSSFIWITSGTLIIAAIVGKLLSGLILFNESKFIRWAVGLAMIPRGEVGLIFAKLGKTNNVFNDEIYAVMIIVVAATTLFAPFMMRAYYDKNQRKPQEK